MNLEKIEIDEVQPTVPSVPSIASVPSLTQIVKKEEKKKKGSLWDRFFNRRNLQKPNKVAVLYLKTNNSAQTIELESNKGFFTFEGKTYHEERDCIYNLGKDRIPLLILEEDGLIPKGNADFYKNLAQTKEVERKCARLQDITLNAIRHAEIVRMGGDNQGLKLNTKAIIGLGIAAIIGFAIFRSYV